MPRAPTSTRFLRSPAFYLILAIALSMAQVLPRRIHPRSTLIEPRSDSKPTKTHHQSDTANQTTSSSGPTGELLIDPKHPLEPLLPQPLITTGLLTAPTSQASSAPEQFGSGLSSFPLFGGNLTISVPTATLASLSSWTHDAFPTPIPNATSASNMSNSTISQNSVQSVLSVSSPEPTPAEPSPAPSTSTTYVYATAPPTAQDPQTQGQASTSSGRSLTISFHMIGVITSVLTYFISTT